LTFGRTEEEEEDILRQKIGQPDYFSIKGRLCG